VGRGADRQKRLGCSRHLQRPVGQRGQPVPHQHHCAHHATGPDGAPERFATDRAFPLDFFGFGESTGATTDASSHCGSGKDTRVRLSSSARSLAPEGLRRSLRPNREPIVIETPPRPPIRAIVASFLFTDLVDFSKGAASEQYVAKAALAASLRSNLAALRESDYWIKDTGDGALIAFINNPEHALYMALALAQDYAQAADGSDGPSHILRTGLHLGTVKETIDVEARRNYIGDGINATKRIMDFAAPGQIAASRNFFEAVANLDTDYAALFQHLGASDDKHGRAHELYAVVPSAEVLHKLRLDLTAAAPRSAEPAAKVVPAISVKRDVSAAAATERRKPSDRAPQDARRTFNPLILLVGLVIVAAAILWFTRGHEPAPATIAPVGGPVVAAPEPAKATDSSPATAPDLTTRTAVPPAITPRPEEPKPVATARPAKDASTSGAAPPVVAPASAPTSNVDTAPKISASTAQPARVPPATDRGGTRCSRIMEKATLGEPLSEEEKKELANACR